MFLTVSFFCCFAGALQGQEDRYRGMMRMLNELSSIVKFLLPVRFMVELVFVLVWEALEVLDVLCVSWSRILKRCILCECYVCSLLIFIFLVRFIVTITSDKDSLSSTFGHLQSFLLTARRGQQRWAHICTNHAHGHTYARTCAHTRTHTHTHTRTHTQIGVGVFRNACFLVLHYGAGGSVSEVFVWTDPRCACSRGVVTMGTYP